MRRHLEKHRTGSAGWLRAAVLGADDGILSTASVMLGVAAAHGSRGNLVVAGLAGLVAGAMSMAAGGGAAGIRYVVAGRAHPTSVRLKRSVLAVVNCPSSGRHAMHTTVTSGPATRTTLKALTSPRRRVEVAVPARISRIARPGAG